MDNLLEIEQTLIECEEYFEARADADWQGDPGDYVPNDAMRLLNYVQLALNKIEKLIPKKQATT